MSSSSGPRFEVKHSFWDFLGTDVEITSSEGKTTTNTYVTWSDEIALEQAGRDYADGKVDFSDDNASTDSESSDE